MCLELSYRGPLRPDRPNCLPGMKLVSVATSVRGAARQGGTVEKGLAASF